MARAKLASPAQSAALPHSLDPLSEAEVTAACEILKTKKKLGPNTRFIHVQLNEPYKVDGLDFKPTDLPLVIVSSTLFDCNAITYHTAIVVIERITIVSLN